MAETKKEKEIRSFSNIIKDKCDSVDFYLNDATLSKCKVVAFSQYEYLVKHNDDTLVIQKGSIRFIRLNQADI